MAQVIKCESTKTSCSVKNETIKSREIFLSSKHHEMCHVIKFERCIMKEVPYAHLIILHLPHLTSLSIINCQLKNITKEDLVGFECLKELFMEENEIEYLPSKLFESTPILENISFANNKIKFIDENVFESLLYLISLDLSNNVNINAFGSLFHTGSRDDGVQMVNVSLHALMKQIQEQCKRPTEGDKIIQLEAELREMRREFEEFKNKMNGSFREILGRMEKIEAKNENDTKDFKLIVGSKFFRINKASFAALSPVFHKLIEGKPEVEKLELTDISVPTVKEILKYVEKGTPPNANADLIELFGASCRLEMHQLTEKVIDLLRHQINPQNAINVLILCNMFDHEELKMKAFREFLKNFPGRDLKPCLASQPEELEKLFREKQA